MQAGIPQMVILYYYCCKENLLNVPRNDVLELGQKHFVIGTTIPTYATSSLLTSHHVLNMASTQIAVSILHTECPFCRWPYWNLKKKQLAINNPKPTDSYLITSQVQLIQLVSGPLISAGGFIPVVYWSLLEKIVLISESNCQVLLSLLYPASI